MVLLHLFRKNGNAKVSLAKKFPKITFKSSSIKKSGSNLVVKGTLSMHGKSKPATLKLRVVKGKNGAGKATTAYRGKLSIKRSDFGIGADSVAAKVGIEDEVAVKLLIVAFQ